MKARTAVSSLTAVVCTLILAPCPIGSARTIRVANDDSADYMMIQAAIDASVDGDTVLVTPGTYAGNGNRDIEFRGKAITVRSEDGPQTCILAKNRARMAGGLAADNSPVRVVRCAMSDNVAHAGRWDPNSPIGYEPFPNGGVVNMGAYGGTAEASKSYFGGPLCKTIIAGNINGDGKVDWRDLEILSRHWLRDCHR